MIWLRAASACSCVCARSAVGCRLLRSLALLGGAVLWVVLVHAVLARSRRRGVLDKRHVLVERIMHGQVALRDRVGAAGLVLVDQLMHVRSHQVLGVLVDVFLVHLLTKDGRPASRATADANAQAKLEDRDDRKREAPTADLLAAQPRPEEASHEAVDERADAADAGHALDARNTPGSNPTRLFRLRLVALCCLCSSCGGTATCATAADDPIEDYHAAKNSAHHGVRRMRLAAPHSWNGWACNAGQRGLRDLIPAHAAGSAGRAACCAG